MGGFFTILPPALALSKNDPRIPTFKDAWVRGYRSIRDLNAEDEAEILGLGGVDVAGDVEVVVVGLAGDLLDRHQATVPLDLLLAVEGVDDLVLQGMKSYIERSRVDYFILEYEDKLSQDKISEILKKYNYKIYFMVRNKNYLIEKIADYPKNEQSLINILAVLSLNLVEYIDLFNFILLAIILSHNPASSPDSCIASVDSLALAKASSIELSTIS